MSQIDKEIDALAEKMAKSVKDPKALMYKTIKELGKEGIKKAIPFLTESELKLLKECLSDMRKAQSMPDKELAPKKTKTKAQDMEQESQTGSDDEDEDLMKPEMAQHPHQGSKTEGWEGQVIKASPAGGAGSVSDQDMKVVDALDSGKETSGKKLKVPAAVDDSAWDGMKKSDEEAELEKARTVGAHDLVPRRPRGAGPAKKPGMDESFKQELRNIGGEASQKVKELKEREKKRIKQKKESEDRSEVGEKDSVKKSEGECGTKAHSEHHKELDQKVKKLVKLEEKEHDKDIDGDGKVEKSSKGEGSRGGNIIGHTKTGKPVYGHKKPMQYNNFTKQDHMDAMNHHWEAWGNTTDSNIKRHHRDMVLRHMAAHERAKEPKVDRIIKSEGETKMLEEGMKKALAALVEEAKEMGFSKEDVKKSLAENEYDLEKAMEAMKKSKLPESGPAEMSQSKMAGQDKGKKEKIDESKGELEIDPEETADEVKVKKSEEESKEEKVEKSLVWTPKNPLAANTLGRNCHYEVNDAIAKSHEEVEEVKKSGGYLNDSKEEKLEKSEGEEKKADVNDLIEKGMDYSMNDIERIRQNSFSKGSGVLVQKSFSEEDMLALLGIDKETAEKLGE